MLNTINQYFTDLGTLGLALNSCIESFFLVPPPDFLLIAMDLKNPSNALYYAFICTLASAFGGGIGYLIGKFGGRPVFNWLFSLLSKNGDKRAHEQFERVEALYNKYGPQAVFFAAFTPIPYKVFTIASGILNMNFWAFMRASAIGRGMRFFIVSAVLMVFGEKIKDNLELVILAVTAVIIAFFYILYKKRKMLTAIENNRKIIESSPLPIEELEEFKEIKESTLVK